VGGHQTGHRLVPCERLAAFSVGVLRALGADARDATEIGQHLADANACGHDSHGVVRLTEYARDIAAGSIIPAAKTRVVTQLGGTALLDAHRCLGIAAAAEAVRHAITMCRVTGIAGIALRHATHIGRLGYYAEAACRDGLILIMTAGAIGPGVGVTVLPGTAARFAGGNPWCFGFPNGPAESAVVVDISSSAVAEGKLRLARAQGLRLDEGLIVDRSGRPTVEAEDFYQGGGLLPLGGPVAHKGVGLLIASALLAALSMAGDPEPTLAGASAPDAPGTAVGGVFVLAIDPYVFGGTDAYRAILSDCLAALRQSARDRGAELTVPGEPEAAVRQRRLRDGVPLPVPVADELVKLARSVGAAPF
jgi:hydroxycarboxylate dehydrogenase B